MDFINHDTRVPTDASQLHKLPASATEDQRSNRTHECGNVESSKRAVFGQDEPCTAQLCSPSSAEQLALPETVLQQGCIEGEVQNRHV